MSTRLAVVFLLVLTFVAVAAPWLPLRDPARQPDTLVLRDLPPLSRVHVVLGTDGRSRYASDVRERPDGSVVVVRGSTTSVMAPDELAPGGPAAWHTRPLYLLGTDRFGRDLLSRIVWGARTSLVVGLLGAAFAIGLGTAVGLLAGLAGRWGDALLMRTTDLFLSVPRLFLALLLVALWRPSFSTTVVVLGATTWMTAARLVRAEVLSLREREFVEAARALGATRLRIGIFHLLPAAAGPVWIEGPLRVGDTILLEAALSFLGLGVLPPTPSWGNIVADGRASLAAAWWVPTSAGLLTALTALSLSVVAERARSRVRAAAPTAATEPGEPGALESSRGSDPLVAGSAAR